MSTLDLSWLDELAPLQIPVNVPPKPKQRKWKRADPTPSAPRRAAAGKPAEKRVTSTTTAPAKKGPPTASSHGQRGQAHPAHDAHDHPVARQVTANTKRGGGQGSSKAQARSKASLSAKQVPQVREQIPDRHFLGALDEAAIVVQGPLPQPPPVRADIAEVLVIDSDSDPEPETETKIGQNGKRGRREGKSGGARPPPKPRSKMTTMKERSKPQPKGSKPKATPKVPKPKAETAKGKGKGKRMLRKTREASPSPLSSPPPVSPPPSTSIPLPPRTNTASNLASPLNEHDKLKFVPPAHRLFVGRPARSPFLFGTEGPWSAENLAWIEGRDLEEVRPKKWKPLFWQ